MTQDSSDLRDQLIVGSVCEVSTFSDVQRDIILPVPKTRLSLRTWRFLAILLGMTPGFFVQFHRYCANISAIEMAETYGVELERISVFASGYFYSYALMQPLIGLLADIVITRRLIICALLGSAVGSVITSFSTTLFVGVIGRIIVGISCSPLYVSG
jgi:MFS family permease